MQEIEFSVFVKIAVYILFLFCFYFDQKFSAKSSTKAKARNCVLSFSILYFQVKHYTIKEL